MSTLSTPATAPAAAPRRPLTPPAAPARDAFLSQIPSETTLAERVLLFDLFRRDWSGKGKVIEIGPFLGGTTRAIAWGMLHHPALAADAEMHVFDRFGPYYTPAELRRCVSPLVAVGGLAAEEADRLCQEPGFLSLYHAIHRPHAYYDLLRIHDRPMPDLPEEVDTSDALALFDHDHDLGALFIDGCKSWASTLYAMRQLLPRTRVGAPVIFQDFGWYTCFWLSSFVHAVGDMLEWVCHQDCTYVFRLRRAVTAEDIASRFARTPAEMGLGFFERASSALFKRSQTAGDNRGALIAQLHHIAALVTLGRFDLGARILQRINPRDYLAHVRMIQGCIKSPTYHPGGKQILWTDGR